VSKVAKILIKEATCHSSGGGATVQTMGSTLLQVYSMRIDERVTHNRCGPSREIEREPKVIEYVRLAGKDYVVEPVGTTFDSDRRATEDGCEYEVTVDIKDGVMFEPDPPLEIVRLIEDYR
jgi:hypothetical protein